MANTKVTGDLIANGTLTATNLADSAVTTDKLANSSVTAAKLNSITTDNISEGTNLFYTDARVGTYLSGNGYDTATNIIAAITDSAPTTLDTLNELAAALGDDPNFATTVTNSIATKLPLAGGTISGNLTVSGSLTGTLATAAQTNVTSVGTLSGLEVSGDVSIADKIVHTGDTNTAIRFPSNDTVTVETAGSERMRIDASGNVGIGTSSTSSKLTVADTGNFYSASISGGSSGNFVGIGTDVDVPGIQGWTSGFGGSTNLLLNKYGGNVGIGVSNPVFKLDIAGQTASHSYIIQTSGGGVATGFLGGRSDWTGGATDNNLAIGTYEPNMCFFTNNSGAERMRIDSSGILTVGAETGSNRTSHKIQLSDTSEDVLSIQNATNVAGSKVTLGLFLRNSNNAAREYAKIEGLLGANSAGAEAGALLFSTIRSGTLSERMRISSAGAVGINNTSPIAQLTISASNNFQTNGTLVNITDAIDTRIGFYHQHAGAGFNSAMELKYTARSQSSAFEFLRLSSNAAIDNEFRFRGDGQAYADGSWNGGGADYAEYFETLSGSAIDRGISVFVDGDKVRPATESDDASKIIGVVRPKGSGNISSMVGNSAWNKWNKKYLTDDFDEYIREEHNVIEWIEIIVDEEGNESEKKHSYESHNIPKDVVIPEDATIKTYDEKGNKFDHRKLNPDYDESFEYIPREQRDEWVIVGLLGQVPMLKGQPVNPNWIKMKDISETVELWFIK